MALLQQGRVSLGFLGAAEVDRQGNLNSTEVLSKAGNHIRLPGSGGACDIAALAGRYVALLSHEKERFPVETKEAKLHFLGEAQAKAAKALADMVK